MDAADAARKKRAVEGDRSNRRVEKNLHRRKKNFGSEFSSDVTSDGPNERNLHPRQRLVGPEFSSDSAGDGPPHGDSDENEYDSEATSIRDDDSASDTESEEEADGAEGSSTELDEGVDWNSPNHHIYGYGRRLVETYLYCDCGKWRTRLWGSGYGR